jgi:hypothetical protein
MSAHPTPFTEGSSAPGTVIDRAHPTDIVESTAIELFEAPVSAPTKEQGIVITEDGSASMLDTIVEPGETLAGLAWRSRIRG